MASGRWLPHVCVLLAVGLTALAGVASSDSFTLLLLAVSAVLIMVGGPLAALLAVLAALPFWMMQIGVGGWIWSPLELALVACAGVTALSAGRDVLRTRRFRALSSWMPPADLTFLAGALAMVAVVSLAWVAEPSLRSDSIRSLRRTILEPMVVIPAASYAMRRGWQRPVCLWIVIPGLAVSVLAVVQFLLDRSTVDIGGFARPIGTFTHPNNLAFYLERVIWLVPVGVLLALRNRKLAIGLSVLVFIAALVTLSRGLMIGLSVGAVVFGFSLVRRHVRIAVAIVAGASALVVLSRVIADSESSVDARMAIWRSSLSMLRDHPFTGVGLDQFFGQYGTRYVRPEGWAERYTSHPHNLLLDFWLSLGLAGVVVLWLFGESLWSRLRSAVAAPDWTLQRAAVAMLVAGAAHGLVDNGFFLPDLATWTWLGLVMADLRSPDADESSRD